MSTPAQLHSPARSLALRLAHRERLVRAVVGSGMAPAAADGGADFLVVLSAGYFHKWIGGAGAPGSGAGPGRR